MLYPPPMGPPPTVQGLGSHDDKPYSPSNPTENGDMMRINNKIRYGTRFEGLQACDPEYWTGQDGGTGRSEEQTSESQSLMRIPYAVFCLDKKKKNQKRHKHNTT